MNKLIVPILVLFSNIVIADGLSPPTQMLPVDESKDVVKDSVTFKWQGVVGTSINPITGYRVVISENKKFTGYLNTQKICIDKTCIAGATTSPTATTFTTPLRLSNKVYYWKVQAFGASNGTWSKINSFKTASGSTNGSEVIPPVVIVPTITSINVNPSSVVQGNTLTFSTMLSDVLPSGYSVKVDYGNGLFAMSGSDKNYSLILTPTVSAAYKIGIYDAKNVLKGNQQTGNFSVIPPVIAIPENTFQITARCETTATDLKQYTCDSDVVSISAPSGFVFSKNTLTGGEISGNGSEHSCNVNWQNSFDNPTVLTLQTHAKSPNGLFTGRGWEECLYSVQTIQLNNSTLPNSTKGDVETFVSGSKTFSYTKISNDGSELPKTAKLGTGAKDWACTKDNNTGLIWEVKTDDDGLRDKDWYYSWYKPEGENGGFAGYQNGNGHPEWCKGSDCDTYAFTNAVNKQGLCGANDWRMPTNEELKGLVFCSDGKTKTLGKEEYGYICTGSPTAPTINTTYFPDIKDNYWFWSFSPYASFSYSAWFVYFYSGHSDDDGKGNYSGVRLVR